MPITTPCHRFRGLWALLVACVAGAACSGERPLELAGSAAGRDLVLVSVDTVRADRLSSYGYHRPTTPAIDRLLARGVRFESAMAPRSITWPSLASVLTGLYPSGHGVVENGYELPDELTTLPLALSAAGYQTGAFLSNMCRANHQGWDAFRCSGGEDGKTLRRALEWVSGLDPERPYFLWVHLFAAHPPYYNGGDRAQRLDPGYEGLLGTKKWRLERVMRESIVLEPRDVEHLDALYDAALMGTDGLVGRLVEGIEGHRTLDEAVVVFLADHGEELYDHNGYIFHACSVYQTTLHVPLGLAAPGLLPAEAAVPQTVELIDVAPTLYELLGIDLPAGLHGTSLLPHLERPGAGGERPAFSEYGDTALHTALLGGWKLVDNPEGLSPVCLPRAPADHYPIAPVELYHLATDPEELDNLADAEPERVARLRQLIEERFSGLGERGGPQEIPEDLKRELEGLGYIAGGSGGG